MSGQCIEKLPHTCGTSDGLQVFLSDDGTYSGYCFSCDTYVPKPYGEEGEQASPQRKVLAKTPADIQGEIDEIGSYRTVPRPERSLREGSLAHFNIRQAVSEGDGQTPVVEYYPYTRNGKVVGYKARFIPDKKFWCVGSIKDAELFGWQQALAAAGRALFITEGELDAVALYQALKDSDRGTRYEHYNPSVVSLRAGAGSAAKDLSRWAKEIQAKWKEVVLVLDQDEAGQSKLQEILKVLPHAQTVTLPAKDANQCVMDGRSKALADIVKFQRERPVTTSRVMAADLYDLAVQPVPMGLSWPWEGLTKMTRGIRMGETIYLGSGVKMGKTTIVDTLVAHMIVKHDLPCFVAQPEEATHRTVQHVVGKVVNRIFTDPEIPFDREAFDRGFPLVKDKLSLLNLYQDLEWPLLRAEIMASIQDGAKAIFIDPITNITNGMTASAANETLQDFGQEVATIAKDNNVVVFLFCHLKAPGVGTPHERGGEVYSNQFAGSRAMMRSCHLMLGLEGNKDPNLTTEERNIRKLVVLEDRAFGASGYIRLYYDENTGVYSELDHA